jgi:hypothetical protein
MKYLDRLAQSLLIKIRPLIVLSNGSVMVSRRCFVMASTLSRRAARAANARSSAATRIHSGP